MLTTEMFDKIRSSVESAKVNQQRLLDYYLGKHDILNNNDTSISIPERHNIVINSAYYITELLSGFITAKPVDYAVNKEDKDKMKEIANIYQEQDIFNTDIDIATNLSIFGEAWEYLYFEKNNEGNVVPKSISLEGPFNCYIGYSNDVEKTPKFGVYWSDFKDEDDKTVTIIRYVDNVNVIEYESTSKKSFIEVDRSFHTFGHVPLIKYSNNKFNTGDFEQVITLIDSVNTLQSSRVMDITQYVNSILVVFGGKLDSEVLKDIKKNRAASIPDGVDMKYITKSLDEASVQTLVDDLKNDLHKISMTPNMSDVNFSANASGVAMKYKLLQFNQLAKKKANFMGRGLKQRLLMYSSALSKDIKLSDVDVTFSLNLPVNEVEIAQIVQQLQGIVGQSTLLNQLPFVLDADEEIKEVNKQREDRMQSEMNSYQNVPINKDVKIDEQVGK